MRVSTLRQIALTLSMSVLCVAMARVADAQFDNGQSAIGGQSMGNGQSIGGAGGGAMADFDTLMNLIQQTIDPDSWLAAGGTSNILPYPSGVFVDPAGHMKRVDRSRTDLSSVAGLEASDDPTMPSHPWRSESRMRTVSLKGLDRALEAQRQRGLRADRELLQLAGLTKITYVRVDSANEDILITGPAESNVFGFELQDVAVVAALINSTTDAMGCSIEPSDDGLRAAQKFVQAEGTVARLAKNPRMVVEQMQNEIGPHNVIVFGMDANTGTAVALIDADEHMKKVGFGTVSTRSRVDSYFDHLDRQGKVPTQSMIRWWFAYNDEPIRVDTSGNLFQLPERCVSVLSEQQWMGQQGRVATGKNDLAADAFAQGISEHLPALRRTDISYARLNAVFELGLALQLAIEATGQPDLRAWLPNLCAMGANAPKSNTKPRTVEGLTTWHKMKNGTVVAVVSGGVKIDAASQAQRGLWQESKFLASSVLPVQPERPSPVRGAWWWDAK